jgi:hypothetical protein
MLITDKIEFKAKSILGVMWDNARMSLHIENTALECKTIFSQLAYRKKQHYKNLQN